VIALMDHFGLSRASLFGHDRGGRVAYRLALDHPERVARLAVLDIVPTLDTWEAMDAAFAMSCYHWMFLAQPSPVPEQLIAGAPIAYLEHTLASWTATKSLAAFSPAALAYYRAAMAQPERIAAMCDDYRAGWFVDRLHDEADRAAGKRIGCPVLALWGKAGLPAGAVEEGATPLSVWRQWATDADGAAIAASHFIPEENPAATIAALRAFLSER